MLVQRILFSDGNVHTCAVLSYNTSHLVLLALDKASVIEGLNFKFIYS